MKKVFSKILVASFASLIAFSSLSLPNSSFAYGDEEGIKKGLQNVETDMSFFKEWKLIGDCFFDNLRQWYSWSCNQLPFIFKDK